MSYRVSGICGCNLLWSEVVTPVWLSDKCSSMTVTGMMNEPVKFNMNNCKLCVFVWVYKKMLLLFWFLNSLMHLRSSSLVDGCSRPMWEVLTFFPVGGDFSLSVMSQCSSLLRFFSSFSSPCNISSFPPSVSSSWQKTNNKTCNLNLKKKKQKQLVLIVFYKHI